MRFPWRLAGTEWAHPRKWGPAAFPNPGLFKRACTASFGSAQSDAGGRLDQGDTDHKFQPHAAIERLRPSDGEAPPAASTPEVSARAERMRGSRPRYF